MTADHPGGIVVTIPARNEVDSVGAVIRSLPAEVGGHRVQALVIDDHSTDGTAEAARAAGAEVIATGSRQGQGAALCAGYAHALARGAVAVAAMDADGQHEAADLPALLLPVLAGEVDVTVGSRVLGAADPTVLIRWLGVRVFAVLMSAATGRRVTDPACGLHAASAEALRRMPLQQDQFHTAEFLVVAATMGLRVREVPVTVRARVAGESRKPPTVRYATGFLLTILRTRWHRRSTMVRDVG